MRTKVERVNVRNLEKIQEKRLLFQRFVTNIVFSRKRGNIMTGSDQGEFFWTVDGRHMLFFSVYKVKL